MSAVVAKPVVPVEVVVEVVAVAVEVEAAVIGFVESVVGIVIAVAVTAVEPAPELEALGLPELFGSKEKVVSSTLTIGRLDRRQEWFMYMY